jgi:putative two-component system response regulator
MTASGVGADRPAQPTVLIAGEHDGSARRLLADLETAGYRGITAGDGASALRLLAAHACELVFCDVQLSDMEGFDVCLAIKQAPATRQTAVVLLLATDDDFQRRRALEAGADEVAVKPLQRATLLAIAGGQLRISRLSRQLDALEGTVVTLARGVEDRDRSSAGLSERVAHWAMQLGAAVDLSEEQLTALYKAALLHDVGTLSVPVAILSKEGRLDPAEYGQVKQHPVIGEELLGALPRADDLLPAVRHHHERVDGAGYPDGIRGEEIPLFARIIAIADTFVALTSDRAYRRRRPRDEAVRTLQQGAGKQWDADLVSRFLRVVEEAEGRGHQNTRPAG